MTCLGYNFRNVLQGLFDGILGHVPLKSCDVCDQIDWMKENKAEVNSSNEECSRSSSVIEAFWPPLASRFSWTLSRLSSRTSAMYWATFFTTLWRRSQDITALWKHLRFSKTSNIKHVQRSEPAACWRNPSAVCTFSGMCIFFTNADVKIESHVYGWDVSHGIWFKCDASPNC